MRRSAISAARSAAARKFVTHRYFPRTSWRASSWRSTPTATRRTSTTSRSSSARTRTVTSTSHISSLARESDDSADGTDTISRTILEIISIRFRTPVRPPRSISRTHRISHASSRRLCFRGSTAGWANCGSQRLPAEGGHPAANAHDTGHRNSVSAAQTHPSGTTSTIAVRSAYASSIRQMAVSTFQTGGYRESGSATTVQRGEDVRVVEPDRLNVYGNPAQFINSMKT